MQKLILLFYVLLWSGSATAGYEEALYFYNRGDYVIAAIEFSTLAKQGNAKSQYDLGRMYEQGQGVPQDNRVAFEWYRMAAEQGYASAQYHVGLMYDEGKGVPRNHMMAVEWLCKAAAQGNADAQSRLGFMYEYGLNVPQDKNKASYWYGKAAEQGDKDSLNKLNGTYDNYEDAVDTVALAPPHQQGAAETGIFPEQDAYSGSSLAQADRQQLEDRRRMQRRILLRRAQIGYQQLLAAEDIEWQETVSEQTTLAKSLVIAMRVS